MKMRSSIDEIMAYGCHDKLVFTTELQGSIAHQRFSGQVADALEYKSLVTALLIRSV